MGDLSCFCRTRGSPFTSFEPFGPGEVIRSRPLRIKNDWPAHGKQKNVTGEPIARDMTGMTPREEVDLEPAFVMLPAPPGELLVPSQSEVSSKMRGLKFHITKVYDRAQTPPSA